MPVSCEAASYQVLELLCGFLSIFICGFLRILDASVGRIASSGGTLQDWQRRPTQVEQNKSNKTSRTKQVEQSKCGRPDRLGSVPPVQGFTLAKAADERRSKGALNTARLEVIFLQRFTH